MTDDDKVRVASYELVPLIERLRYMRFFRYGLIVAVTLFGTMVAAARPVSTGWLAAACAGYFGLSLLSDGIRQLWPRAGLALFGLMLMVDSVFLVWAAYATGGTLSPIRYLLLVHLIAVSLLGSYRTGLKLAMWDSLLLYVVFYAQEAKILHPVSSAIHALPGTDYRRLGAFVTACWLVSIVTATFSAINERELRRRRFDLEALAHLGADLEGAADSFDVADVLLDRLIDTFEVDRILLLGAPEVDLVLLARRGSEQAIGSVCPAGIDSVLLAAWESRETLLVSELDPEVDAWLDHALPNAKNLIITPLSAEGRSVGVLIIEHAERNGSRVERRVVSMVERFASHVALALRNAWLLEQVQTMATTDGLTGIANRRNFDTALERELARAARNGDEVTLVMLDLDHFKQLNDTHGHQIGDEVLRQVADVLAADCRDFDTAARYGGEEFAVVLPGCTADEAGAAAERLRAIVRQAPTFVPITASVGVATFPVHAPDAVSLVKAADEALYESKRAGRNRVTIAARAGAEPQPANKSS